MFKQNISGSYFEKRFWNRHKCIAVYSSVFLSKSIHPDNIHTISNMISLLYNKQTWGHYHYYGNDNDNYGLYV